MEIIKRIEGLEKEANEVYVNLVLPNWNKQFHGMHNCLYGYMMGTFSIIDILSGYWKGDISSRGQTSRMINFMNNYLRNNTEANSVAVQIWRHKLMHTSKPRYLKNNTNGKSYRWLLHWSEHLPKEKHYTFHETDDHKILNVGLMYMIEDLKNGCISYNNDFKGDSGLQANYSKVEQEIQNYEFLEVPL